jgi:hypothetical protein
MRSCMTPKFQQYRYQSLSSTFALDPNSSGVPWSCMLGTPLGGSLPSLRR